MISIILFISCWFNLLFFSFVCQFVRSDSIVCLFASISNISHAEAICLQIDLISALYCRVCGRKSLLILLGSADLIKVVSWILLTVPGMVFFHCFYCSMYFTTVMM
jgi:hypothetical protein